MTPRLAVRSDVPGMSAVLEALRAAGKRTARADPGFVLASYFDNPDFIRCTVAEEGGAIAGFQVLLVATADNRFAAPVGIGIIGTHVAPDAGRGGIGTRLFAETRDAARAAGLTDLEAYIDYRNIQGQSYYETMGFRTWRVLGEAVCKRFRIDADGTAP